MLSSNKSIVFNAIIHYSLDCEKDVNIERLRYLYLAIICLPKKISMPVKKNLADVKIRIEDGW